MELASTKIAVLTLLGVLRLLSGLLPLRLARSPSLRVERALVRALNFGGGVLLATCFMHMLPEVRETVEAVRRSGRVLDQHSSFPLPELLFCLGFFLVYVLEAVAHRVVGHHAQAAPITVKPQPCCSTVDAELNKTDTVDKFIISADPDNNTVVPTWSRPKSSARIAPANSQVHLLASTLSLDRSSKLPSPEPSSIEPSILGHIRGALVVLALSFHSVFEGLAIGLQQTVRDVWYMFAAVSIHACGILFCVGLELAVSNLRPLPLVLYVVVLALTAPIGVALGVVVTVHAPADSAVQTLVVAVLQGVAGGTLLYVTFFEVLHREKKRSGDDSALSIVCMLLGFAIMAGLQAIGGHDHGKGQSHWVLPPNATAEDVHRHEHGLESH